MERGTLRHCCWECNWGSLYGKQYRGFSKNIGWISFLIIYSLPGIVSGVLSPKQPNGCGWYDPLMAGRGGRHQTQVWMSLQPNASPQSHPAQSPGRVRTWSEVKSPPRRGDCSIAQSNSLIAPKCFQLVLLKVQCLRMRSFFHGILILVIWVSSLQGLLFNYHKVKRGHK